jgi:ElaB/YqjD/DUF883 family membrane-anchored ribosome-binding protein
MAARDPNEIRSEIEHTREEIAHSLMTLKSSVSDATDWKSYVRRQPLAFVGGAFALGLLIGLR